MQSKFNQLEVNLRDLREYINESNLTNSNNDKIAVLKKYSSNEFVKKVLHYTYNNQLQFNVTTENLKKNSDLRAPDNLYADLFQLLDDLNERNITGHHAIQATNAFLYEFKEFEREIGYIIDRNLQTRVTGTIINKVIPDLIPEFEVALGYDYDSLDESKEDGALEKATAKAKKLLSSKAFMNSTVTEAEMIQEILASMDKRPDVSDGSYLASRKMDGLRAVALIDDAGDAIFKSREGNVFTTFSTVAAELKTMGFRNVVLDGEMCLIKPDGSDDFNGMQKQFSKKNHTIENARFRIFDILTHEEFKSRVSDYILSDRLKRLTAYTFNDVIKPIEQIRITSQRQLNDLRVEGEKLGWEGWILRKDTFYNGRRSSDILKLKVFIEGEFLVTGVENTLQRVIENGKEITKEMLGAVFVDYRGTEVRVGSGYTKEEREMFYADKHLILGKMITVQYFEETNNKKGTNKMRFPTFKRVYEKF